MENKSTLRPLTEEERQFSVEHHDLINRFLKLGKYDIEEFYSVAVFGYLLSVEKYLNTPGLKEKYSFENVSYMYMRREMWLNFRAEQGATRQSENGKDTSYECMTTLKDADSLGWFYNPLSENQLDVEYNQMMEIIKSKLTAEQALIMDGKIEGYSLKEIADNNGIKQKRVYKQFDKIKTIIADVMEFTSAAV